MFRFFSSCLIITLIPLGCIFGCAQTIVLDCDQPKDITIVLRKKDIPIGCWKNNDGEQVFLTNPTTGQKFEVTGILFIDIE